MDDEHYQNLLMQEQAEIATSIQLEASLAAMKAKNDNALKEMLQLEQELAAVTSEYETLNRFKGFSQEQCFSAKAESYKINGEKQKAKQLLRDVDQSTAYWKDVFKRSDASVKTSDEHVAALYDSPWVIQKLEAKAEIGKMTEKLRELQQQFAGLENSRKYKGPRNSLDNQTVEMFRNMVRSELRLHPQRAPEPSPRIDRSETHMNQVETPPRVERQSNHRLESTPTPPRTERGDRFESTPPPRTERFGRLESTPARKQNEVPRHISPPLSQSQNVEAEPEDDIDFSAARMEFEDDNSGLNIQSQEDNHPSQEDNQSSHEDNQPSQEDNQPSHEDNQPSQDDNQTSQEDNQTSQEENQPFQEVVQDYEAEEEPEEEQNLFNDSADALQVNITNTREDGNDFFNLLGDTHGSNSGTPMFSFLQEHTNNSGDGGGANFFFGNSPQASKNNESSHGFLF